MKSINTQPTLWISVREEAVNYPRPYFSGGAYTASDNACTKKEVWPRETRIFLPISYPLSLSTVVLNSRDR